LKLQEGIAENIICVEKHGKKEINDRPD